MSPVITSGGVLANSAMPLNTYFAEFGEKSFEVFGHAASVAAQFSPVYRALATVGDCSACQASTVLSVSFGDPFGASPNWLDWRRQT